MLRSMYSGISGLDNHQQKMDVIGNNLANVNTHGFKKGRAMFKDMVSQQTQGATGPTETQGGTNAMQVGLGAQMGSIDNIHEQGSLQNTGRQLDLGISGDGFFAVGELEDDSDWDIADDDIDEEDGGIDGVNVSYSRAGNFYMDEEGYVVNQDGQYLLGASADPGNNVDLDDDIDPADFFPTDLEEFYDDGAFGDIGAIEDNASGDAGFGRIRIPTEAESFSVGSDGSISFVLDGDNHFAGQLQMAQFANPEGMEKVGDNLFQPTDNSGIPEWSTPGAGGAGEIVAGTLEMSNVDMSEEFTEMITAQRGLQANTRIITTSDEILQELVNMKQ
ncbi:flagellar hook protein FlgE [Salsuginibacillus halophilus]|uniref:Flagellar hook protein FlgE n=1 Tax=Salsuginibacillus halophilus TaxID=517424 RepID=A0A2P8HY77_9BACI|nr:flagellar hook-basal body complex protein [Salsuginibacillus halophilus]PSL51196.1 flagellar hook protein FlgE [Salsuginibacillus halophilus]